MTPKELRKISEDYYKEDLNPYFIKSVTNAAKTGKTSIILDNDLRVYSESDNRANFIESVLQLGYKLSYRGDSRLGEDEYTVLSWDTLE